MSKSKSSKDGEISATVEESNRMRAALGIKPLKEGASEKKEVKVNLDKADKPTEAEVKARTAAAKTRREHEELVKGEGLGDILAREEGKGGAAEWVSRTRGKDGSMKPVGESRKRKDKDGAEKEEEAPRLKVRHDAASLPDGETTLTLSDKPILNEDGDIDDRPDELSNVKMTDVEKAKHNEAVRKQVEYDPTKEGANILDKYDELKTGPTGFVVGGAVVGSIDEKDPEKRLSILTALSEKQSLETQNRVQSDFYTTEEMAKFRKPAKTKGKRRMRQADAKEKDDQIAGPTSGSGMLVPGRPADAGSDEEDPELYEQLSKQRRLVRRSEAGAVRKGEAALTAVSERIQMIEVSVDDDKEKDIAPPVPKSKEGEHIAMTATTEFCNVVQTPMEKMETMKHESFRGSTLYKQQAAQRKGLKASSAAQQKRGLPVDDEAATAPNAQDEDENNLMEESLDLSCASGLAYLRARAQIGCDQDSHRHRKIDNRPLEMSTVDGDIKLEYRDDFGRVQTPKEAFRAISWKFHGKVPGRKNMERRILRLENEMRLKSMNPVESLPTIRALKHVQRQDAKPYMVLSGANEK